MHRFTSPVRGDAPPMRCGGTARVWPLIAVAIGLAALLYGASRMLAPDPEPAPAVSVDDAVDAGAPASAFTSRKAGADATTRVRDRPPPSTVGSVAPSLANDAVGLHRSGQTAAGRPGGSRFSAWSVADELMEQLTDIRLAYEAAPEESDEAIRDILNQLGAIGDEAIPAIRRFLSTGDDLDFALVSVDGRVVDARSLRLSMLEMLGSMDSPEAVGTLQEVLARTASPEEIQVAARMLETQYPGEYRDLALDRTRGALRQLWSGGAEDDDPAPLYQLLAELGDDDDIAELEQWIGGRPLYSTVALAQVPEGYGIPGLVSLAQEARDPSLQRLTTQLLAQSAGHYPEAADAMVSGLADGSITIPDQLWPKIGEALTGHYELQLLKPDVGELPAEVDRNPFRTIQVGGASGTSTIYITDVEDMTPEERLARLSVVEQLLAQDLGPAATRALERARTSLQR